MRRILRFLFGGEKQEFSREERVVSNMDCFELCTAAQDCFVNRRTSEALVYLDKAIEHGCEQEISSESYNLFDLRARCLQGLRFHYDAIKDFDKSISSEPNDCNMYFSRSVSKAAILDFEGEIADLEKAIQLSIANNTINEGYNRQAQEQGFESGVVEMFELRLVSAKSNLASHLRSLEQIQNATTPESKEFWQNKFNERRDRRLQGIYRR